MAKHGMFEEQDIEVKVLRSAGIGGDQMTTGMTGAGVGVTHIQTGCRTFCSTERTEIANMDKAVRALELLVYGTD